MTLKEIIIEKFNDGSFVNKSDSQIFILLGISGKSNIKEVNLILDELEKDGTILQMNNKFVTPESLGAFTGTLRGNERGFAFITADDGSGDYFIPHRSLNGAMHNDTVLAVKTKTERSDDEAQVIKILKRGMTEVVGTFVKDGKVCFVIPDDSRFFNDIYVPISKAGVARTNEKVICKVTSYPKDKSPEGEIIEVLGKSGDINTEILGIIKAHNLNTEFPANVLKEAEKQRNSKIILENRRDFRNLLTITIDGEDSRDFDDAISVIRTENNGYTLYVHIADVSNYVLPKSELDKEAFARGTSVYFPDRVLPMLPEALSNDICSLKEGEDRLTLTCILTYDKEGKLLTSEMAESVINSNHRLTYTKVSAIIDGNEDLRREYADILTMIDDMLSLTNMLVKKRRARGSINLEVKECQIMVNEKGEISLNGFERDISHDIIEEFMLSANEAVAEFINQYELPFIYRVHEQPSVEKAIRFKEFIKGLSLPPKYLARFNVEDVKPYDLQNILKELENEPVFPVVNKVMLRSMQKAKYLETNLGHFGLASDCYCHFTSPIRRYPDLIVHRVLKLVLNGLAGEVENMANFVVSAAENSSKTERNADDAERQVDDLFKVVYMNDFVGEEFDGIISSVTAFGIFVELPNTVEGLIKIVNLPQDNYTFVEEKFLLQGQFNAFKLGERLKIKLVACDILTRKCEFELVEKID